MSTVCYWGDSNLEQKALIKVRIIFDSLLCLIILFLNIWTEFALFLSHSILYSALYKNPHRINVGRFQKDVQAWGCFEEVLS